MIEVKDYSTWHEYVGAAEGSGRSEKVWLEDGAGKIGLFKFPKIDPATAKETTEHVSEHLAHRLGEILWVPTAEVDIGIYGGRVGSMSYRINQPYEYLIEGINFVSGRYPGYDADKMVDTETGTYYCMEHIFNSTRGLSLRSAWIEMMVFDFLIGNTDRHQSNWAVLCVYADSERRKLRVYPCPFYDNGSSLCCYINGENIKNMFSRDTRRFDALTETKSQSRIRIDGSVKRTPPHAEVVKYLLDAYDETYGICNRFLYRLDTAKIDSLLDKYPPEILDPMKNQLIRRFLKRKLDILTAIVKGEY